MNREKQVEYCKRCTEMEFDMNQGILCSLTHQKADFEVECADYEMDTAKVDYIRKNQAKVKSGRFGFGMMRNKSHNFHVNELTQKQLFIIAYDSAKAMKWNIGTMHEDGFLAYTPLSFASLGEQVEVKIGVGNITISSECNSNQLFDWGKNIGNIERFLSKFDSRKSNISVADADERWEELLKDFVKSNESGTEQTPEKIGKLSGFMSIIIPSKGYFVTPILVQLNVLMFIVMIISGVNFFLPSVDSLVLWGANIRPLTVDGEWWRLITSVFIHVGIFHLLMNMYALIYIGLILEPYLGKARFLSAYLLTGIAASVSSLYWHEFTASAGASGAIFGMYGIFLALLTTNLIEKSARRSLLISIGIFVMYNLMNGLNDGMIDNAAHIGGLISGLLIGYSFYPGMVKKSTKVKFLTIGALSLIITLGSFAVLKSTSTDITKYLHSMEEFAIHEASALRIYTQETITDQQLLDEISNNGLQKWHQCLGILNNVDSYNLPAHLKKRNQKMKTYCELRIKAYELIRKGIIENSQAYAQEIHGYSEQIERIVNELSAVGN